MSGPECMDVEAVFTLFALMADTVAFPSARTTTKNVTEMKPISPFRCSLDQYGNIQLGGNIVDLDRKWHVNLIS